MNFFESELKQIMGNSSILKDQKYVGRMCYGVISEDLRARVEFVTLGVHDHYAGIKASIINRKEGVVDSMLLRFTDIWGKPKTPAFKEGIAPHIWSCDGKYEWYGFHPQAADYQKIADSMENYLSVFQDMEMTQSPNYGSQQISP